jgi:hypothetical protein
MEFSQTILPPNVLGQFQPPWNANLSQPEQMAGVFANGHFFPQFHPPDQPMPIGFGLPTESTLP